MTLKNRYDEVMKKIEVTDDMRDRILNNISTLNFDKPSKNAVFFPQYKKYLFIASCFVILIVGSVIVRNTTNLPSDPPIQVTPDIVSYHSVEELSDAIDFTVKEIELLSFDVESVKYTSYWGSLADIEYTGSDNTAILRMAAGEEDISGYFGEFTSIESHTVNGYDVTIKGNDNQYILAIWHEDGFSYALQFSEAVSEQEILDTIQSIK